MRVRKFVSLTAVACVAMAMSAVGAVAADADEEKVPDVIEVGGGARGLYMDVGDDSVGPLPVVELPSDGGGPFEDDEVVFDNLFVEVYTEGAVGPDGFASSWSSFSIEEALTIDTGCFASADGTWGATFIESSELDLPSNPAPGEIVEIVDEDTGVGTTAILNQQIVSDDGQSITVLGVQFTNYDLETDEVFQTGWYGEVTCSATLAELPDPGPEPEPVREAAPAEAARVEPTFTG